MTRQLPEGESLLVRTDYSDDKAWRETLAAATQPWDFGGDIESYAALTPVDDPAFDGLTLSDLRTLIGSPPPYYIFLADSRAITDPEHPILAVDTGAEESNDAVAAGGVYPTFRVAPKAMASVENNLSIANMDFEEFAGAIDADGVFRGF